MTKPPGVWVRREGLSLVLEIDAPAARLAPSGEGGAVLILSPGEALAVLDALRAILAEAVTGR